MNEALGQAFFAVCSLAALVGALATVLSKNPIRSAMSLLLTIGGISGLYLALHAQLLAALQMIVYAGAVVILFVFVIMILGPDATAPSDSKALGWRIAGGTLFGVFALTAASMLLSVERVSLQAAPAELGSVEAIGRDVFTRALVPFELVSLLFVVAVVGALAVASGKPGQPAAPAAKKEGA